MATDLTINLHDIANNISGDMAWKLLLCRTVRYNGCHVDMTVGDDGWLSFHQHEEEFRFGKCDNAWVPVVGDKLSLEELHGACIELQVDSQYLRLRNSNSTPWGVLHAMELAVVERGERMAVGDSQEDVVWLAHLAAADLLSRAKDVWDVLASSSPDGIELLQAGAATHHWLIKPPARGSLWLVHVEGRPNVIRVCTTGAGFYIPGQTPCWGFSHVDKWIQEITPPETDGQ